MPISSESKKLLDSITILGRFEQDTNVRTSFDHEVLSFFDAVSRQLMGDDRCREFPDLVSLGFFLRQKNLEKFKAESQKIHVESTGVGIALHFAPANVPLNFFYSLTFGLLAGNINVVRISTRKFKQVDILIEIVSHLLSEKFQSLEPFIILVRYDAKHSEITTQICSFADARIIWGGDRTISTIKAHPTSLTCREISFRNRYSVSIMNSLSIASMNDSDLKNLVLRFIRDSFAFEQQACSSPRILFWVGSDEESHTAKDRFWEVVNIQRRGMLNGDSTMVEKFLRECVFVIENESISLAKVSPFLNFVTNLDEVRSEEFIGFGTFGNVDIHNLSQLSVHLNSTIQTISYFGFDAMELTDYVRSWHLRGVDRLVSGGLALEMDSLWDGYNLLETLSRHLRVYDL
jgi:hypothetical protein